MNISNSNLKIKELRKKAMALPLSPGVYIMRNCKGNIIYIGKAKMLKNRVSQYFGSDTNHSDKVRQMVSNVHDFEYIICDSEFEALILECSLIKQHKPKYNILLKDDKGYHYIKITNGKWKTIKSALQIDDDGAEYLGPYSSGYIVKQTVQDAQKLFKLPTCNKTFTDKPKNVRPCLNYYIGNCSAPCANKITFNEYNKSLLDAINFIKGGSKISIKQMEEQMKTASENLEFELAARLRDRITAATKITEKQKVTSCTYKNQDVIAFVNSKEKAAVEVFIFRNSRLTDRKQFITDAIYDPMSFRTEFLKQYYNTPDNIPPRIVLDQECEDKDLLERMFSDIISKKVEIIVPQIGEQKRLIEMCRNNAAEYLSEVTGKQSHEMSALDELSKLLNLESPPEFIESFDISNTAGTDNVAGMVVFKNGVPYKKDYKRFKIKSFIGQDDCRSMKEVITRRFTEYLKAEDNTSGFGRMPDLILLDGGITQLNAVNEALKELNITVPVFGMVKDGKHKTNAIAFDGGKIEIKSNRSVYTLISTIQEEVHRFAIGYHHKSKTQNMLLSELTDIPGVGKKTIEKLLKHFRGINGIKNADLDALLKVKGLSRTTAQNIYNYYNAEE